MHGWAQGKGFSLGLDDAETGMKFAFYFEVIVVDLIEKRPEYQLETLINQVIGYTRKKAQTYSQGERIDMADIGNQEVLQATTQPTPSTPEGIPPPSPITPEGAPPSPNFEPSTPEGMPPPQTPELKPEIPLTEEQMSLQEGDKVALNEDAKSGRVWELVGIDGDDVVITTDDFEVGEPDTTRIARLSDLTKIEDDGEVTQEIIDETFKKTKKAIYDTSIFKQKTKDNLLEDELIGALIVEKALSAPLRKIASNAGQNGAVIFERVKDAEFEVGYNAATNELVNMFDIGIIDPAKVTRSTLQNAASIASMVLTTECIIVDKATEENT